MVAALSVMKEVIRKSTVRRDEWVVTEVEEVALTIEDARDLTIQGVDLEEDQEALPEPHQGHDIRKIRSRKYILFYFFLIFI